MPTILSIDTTTNACSCALTRAGEITERFDIIPRQHATRLLPMIDSLMAQAQCQFADLDAVAFGQGPGSFTGLRIAAGVAQGIAFGAGIPVIPISSLAAMAVQVPDDNALVFASLDAKIDEVYWGLYQRQGQGVVPVGEEGLCKPEELPVSVFDDINGMTGVGSGLAFLDRMPALVHERLVSRMADCYPRAGTIASLAVPRFEAGQFEAPETVSPVYLRDKVTHNQ